MKFILSFLFAFSASCFSQVDSVIYGLTNRPAPAEIYLSKINPLTGVVTIISPVSLSTSAQIPNATIDPYSQRFYFQGDANNIVGIDLVTGTLVSSAPISNVNGVYFDQMIFNQSDSTIYGLARKPVPAEVYLAKIDPLTGTVKNISIAPLSYGETIPDAAINPFTKTFYYVNEWGALVSVDMVTGNGITTVITNSNGAYFDQMEFNASDKMIYGLARKSNPPEVRLAKINPVTGVVTNISASSLSAGESIPNSLLDPCNNIYYYQNESGILLGVNCNSGNIISSTAIVNPFGNFNQLTFNYKCFLNFTSFAGIEENSIQDGLKVYPNPVTSRLNVSFEKIQFQNSEIEFVNYLDQTVLKTTCKNEIDVSGLSNGCYLLRINTPEKQQFHSKFIKE